MTAGVVATSILLCLLPIFELRGGIPYAIARGVHPLLACAMCVAANMLVGPLVYGFLATLHRLLSRIRPYRALFERLVERARKRIKPQIDRWGYLGLALFVAIPLPLTGAYTGALGAWVLGMEPRRAWLAIGFGVLIAGVVVTLVVTLGVTALSIFVKPS